MKIRTRILARLLAASGALILMASLLGDGFGGSAAGALRTAAESGVTSTMTIAANVSGGYACDPTEWHLVITQTSDAQAPATITVMWANGATTQVLLDGVTGGTAHYVTAANLDSQVASATAIIADDWSGQFNLSHGPCAASPSASASPVASTSPVASPTGSPAASASPTAVPTPTESIVPSPNPPAAAVTTPTPTGAPPGAGSLPIAVTLPTTVVIALVGGGTLPAGGSITLPVPLVLVSGVTLPAGEIPYGTVLPAGTTFPTGTVFGLQVASLPSTSTQDLEDVPTWVFVLALVLLTLPALLLRGRPRGAGTNGI